MSDNFVRIEAKLIAKGKDAFLVSTGDVQGWIPYSVIKVIDEKRIEETATCTDITFHVREWKAKQVGLI